MGVINDVRKLTDLSYVNLYQLKATSIHNTPVVYNVASRAADVSSLKLKTHENKPDGVIIYSLYGEKKDRVVLVRQYRYTLDDYIYEFPVRRRLSSSSCTGTERRDGADFGSHPCGFQL
mgnify:CR=1 FL=1